jgi:hypothetical protein
MTLTAAAPSRARARARAKLRTAVAAERLGDFAEMTRPGFTSVEGWA